MIGGFFLTPRSVFEHPIFKHQPERLYVWQWMIASAAFKDTRMDANGTIITVKRGQLLTSYRQMSEATGVGVQVIRTLIGKLKTEHAVDTETNTGRLLITICNYDKYQVSDKAANTASNTRATHEQHTKERRDNNSRREGAENQPLEAEPENAPSRSKLDPAKQIFDTGLALLVEAGIAEKKARTIVGGWRKNFDDATVIDALSHAYREQPSDPVAYVAATLKRKRAGPKPGQPMSYKKLIGSGS